MQYNLIMEYPVTIKQTLTPHHFCDTRISSLKLSI
jgi:hypothetical protein